MKSIEPSELSAYVDGELDAERAQQVETVLANDPLLRKEVDALRAMDMTWKSAARSAFFHPTVQLPRGSNVGWTFSRNSGLLLLLIALRFLPKLGDIVAIGVAVHIVALAVAMTWVIRMVQDGDLAASVHSQTH